jgi:type II secretion system protein N
MEYIRRILSWLFQNKGKFVLTFFSTLLFLLLLFPFDDLSDLVSSQVSKVTGNQVYLQFERMGLSLLPKPGMSFDSIYVETKAIPGLKADELTLSPALSSLITQKPAGTITANGFLGGNVEVSVSSGPKSDNGVERQKIVLSAKRLNLTQIRDLAQMPVVLKGNLDASSTALIDLAFREQPDIDLTLKVEKFELPTSNIQTMMGPLTLPEIKLSSLELKGRLAAGKFLIENGVIGKSGDEIFGTIKGNMNLTLQNQGAGIAPLPGAYSFDIDLNVKKSFQDKANLFLSFIDTYKIPNVDGAQYRFKVSAGGVEYPPNISALR